VREKGGPKRVHSSETRVDKNREGRLDDKVCKIDTREPGKSLTAGSKRPRTNSPGKRAKYARG